MSLHSNIAHDRLTNSVRGAERVTVTTSEYCPSPIRMIALPVSGLLHVSVPRGNEESKAHRELIASWTLLKFAWGSDGET